MVHYKSLGAQNRPDQASLVNSRLKAGATKRVVGAESWNSSLTAKGRNEVDLEMVP